MRIGAEALGWHAMEVPRWFHYDGRFNPDGSPLGTRQSMTKTFVPRAVAAGARLMAGTRAVKLIRGTKQWGLAAVQAGEEIAINAEHIFVCAGATQTPALLRRSGITQNIGNTLSMHPTIKVVAKFPFQINHEALGVPVHQVKEFSPRISLGCAISSLPHLMLGVADYPGAREMVRHEWRHMAIYYGMITGPTCGTVRNVGKDAMIRYALSTTDLRDLSRTLRYLSQLMFAAGAAEVYPSIAGLKPLRSWDDLSTLPGEVPGDRTNLMTIHIFASCPMGEDPTRAAVDSYGNVHGVPGLSIHDASILCSAPGVNPQGSVMAFAHRNTMHYLRS
jgi:choline dehydrogenase-like flavoprotein